MEKWKKDWMKKTIPDLTASHSSTNRRILYEELTTSGILSSQTSNELLRNEDLIKRMNLKDSLNCKLRIINYLFDVVVAGYDGFAPYVNALYRTSLHKAFILVCTGFLEHLATEKNNLFAKNVLENIYMGTVTKENLWNNLKGYFHSIMTQENDWYYFLVTLEANDWELPYETTGVPCRSICSSPTEISTDSNWKNTQVDNLNGNFFPLPRVVLFQYNSTSNTIRLTTIQWYNEKKLLSWRVVPNESNDILWLYHFISSGLNTFWRNDIVTELPTTSLNNELRLLANSQGPVDDPNHYVIRKSYLRNVLKGMEYLHSCKPAIVHGEIEPGNIFIFYVYSGRKFAKLGDFGISRYVQECDTKKTEFMAPECRQALVDGVPIKPHTAQDIYSFGATCDYVMSFKQSCSTKDATSFDSRGKTTQLGSEYLSSAKQIIEHMMDENPENRPNSKKILMDPFFLTLKMHTDVMRDFAFALDTVKQELKDQIDNYFISGWEGEEFDWANKIGTEIYDLLRTFKSTGYKKGYNTKSVGSLAILFRNKLCHPKDVVDELTVFKTFYNGELVFDWKKYTAFFLKKIPECWKFVYKLVKDSEYSQHFGNILLNLQHYTCGEQQFQAEH